jgi:hypothetical protein
MSFQTVLSIPILRLESRIQVLHSTLPLKIDYSLGAMNPHLLETGCGIMA